MEKKSSSEKIFMTKNFFLPQKGQKRFFSMLKVFGALWEWILNILGMHNINFSENQR